MKNKRILLYVLVFTLLTTLLVPTIVLAATGGGTGSLTAWGSGKGAIEGGGNITVTGNGDLWIYDHAGDVSIFITGEGTKFTMPDGWVHYEGFEGRAHISGSEITLAISGNHLRMYAHGSGRFALRGQGNYHTSGSGWTLDITLIEATPGEVLLEE